MNGLPIFLRVRYLFARAVPLLLGEWKCGAGTVEIPVQVRVTVEKPLVSALVTISDVCTSSLRSLPGPPSLYASFIHSFFSLPPSLSLSLCLAPMHCFLASLVSHLAFMI